jgi:type IV fimbrial biogenesis protein FimT
MQKFYKGFSLTEMMITVVIIGLALVIAVPNFKDFIGNSQIRTVSESIRNGLQLARAEAVKRNAIVSLTLNSNTSWTVGCVTVTATCPATIQAKPAGEGASSFISLTMTGSNFVRFTSLGTVDPNVPNQLTQVNIDNSDLGTSASKDLRITIGAGGNVRMCDPNISSTSDARHCL